MGIEGKGILAAGDFAAAPGDVSCSAVPLCGAAAVQVRQRVVSVARNGRHLRLAAALAALENPQVSRRTGHLVIIKAGDCVFKEKAHGTNPMPWLPRFVGGILTLPPPPPPVPHTLYLKPGFLPREVIAGA